MMDILLKKGADPHARNGKVGKTPVCDMLDKSYLPGILTFLKYDRFDIHAPVYDGLQALSILAYKESGHIDLELTRFLISKGARCTDTSTIASTLEGNVSPLHIICETPKAAKNVVEFAEIMLSNGVDVNTKTSKQRTPLSIAVAHNKGNLVRFFLNNGANTQLTCSEDGENVIMILA